MEHVQQRNIEKVSRFLDKGLDPNFHDPDTGGMEMCWIFLRLSLSPISRQIVFGFSEVSHLRAGQSEITCPANLLKFMQIIVQPWEISLLGDLRSKERSREEKQAVRTVVQKPSS